MTYTGEVSVGGEMDVRRLPGLTIAKLAVGPMDNNAYLLRCTQTGEGLLIDAANEADRLRELIVFEGLPHCFWNNNTLPESHEAWGYMANFFDRELGR